MKKIVSLLTIAAFTCVAMATFQPALAADTSADIDQMGGFTRYYETHPTTVDQLIATWGKPAQVIPCENGAEKYVFKVKAFGNDEIRFLVKDGRVVGCL